MDMGHWKLPCSPSGDHQLAHFNNVGSSRTSTRGYREYHKDPLLRLPLAEIWLGPLRLMKNLFSNSTNDVAELMTLWEGSYSVDEVRRNDSNERIGVLHLYCTSHCCPPRQMFSQFLNRLQMTSSAMKLDEGGVFTAYIPRPMSPYSSMGTTSF